MRFSGAFAAHWNSAVSDPAPLDDFSRSSKARSLAREGNSLTPPPSGAGKVKMYFALKSTCCIVAERCEYLMLCELRRD